ncbi:MAG: hypothetical protein FJ215_05110 [Ignavibacteria bacterium]|nr:hypothetical protein [Ignavibacteria bacterium]
MKDKKKAGIVVLTLGILVLILSLAADFIGLGSTPGMGYKQVFGLAGGALLVVTGLLLLWKPKSAS